MASSSPSPLIVGFIGAGRMANAIMEGLIRQGVVSDASQIICFDPVVQVQEAMKVKGYTVTSSNQEVCKSASVVILAVKPNYMEHVCQNDISNVLKEKTPEDMPLIISIAAGVSIASMESWLPPKTRLVRVMPNTPCLVGQGAAAYTLGSCATVEKDQAMVERIFASCCGVCEPVQSESLLHAVTGLSGSGPAYVFEFCAALSDAGVRAGLARPIATQLAAQTLRGAAELILETNQHPGVLKDQVTSPGGTTIAGVEALHAAPNFRAGTMAAVLAATKRSMQLGLVPEEEIRNKHNL